MSEHGGGGGEHKVKAVLNIGGEISSTLKSSFNLVTGNIFKIGAAADKAIRHGFRKDIEDGNKSVKALNSEIKKTGDVTGDLTRQMGALVRKIDKTKSIQNLYHGVGNSAGKFARGLGVVSVEATATGWAIYHLTEKYEDYLKTVRVGAKEADMTPQSFAKLKYAAGDQLEGVLKARALFSVNHLANTKKYQAAMKAIGLREKDFKGLDLTSAFLKVGDAIKKYKGDRIGIAKALYGRGGAAALPFIMRGSEENKKRMAMAEKMGLAPTEEDMKKNADYAWSMTKLGMAVDSAKFSIGKAFLPVVEELGDTLSEFMVEHHDDFQKWADKLGKTVKQHLPTMDQLERAFKKLGKAIDWAIDHPTVLKDALGILVAVPFLPAAAALISIASSVTTISATSGLLGLATSNLGSFAMKATALGALGVQLWVIVKGFEAMKDIMDQWDANKSILTDGSAWKGMLKDWAGNDPILGNIFGKNTAEGKVTPEEIQAARNARKFPAATPAGHPSPTPEQPLHGRRAGGNNFTINVHPSQGMDERSLAEFVAKAVKRHFNHSVPLSDHPVWV